MKKLCKKITETIKNGDYTNREAVLAGICLLLFGIVVGVFMSPRKRVMIGSHNGNNNVGSMDIPDNDCEDEDDLD